MRLVAHFFQDDQHFAMFCDLDGHNTGLAASRTCFFLVKTQVMWEVKMHMQQRWTDGRV